MGGREEKTYSKLVYGWNKVFFVLLSLVDQSPWCPCANCDTIICSKVFSMFRVEWVNWVNARRISCARQSFHFFFFIGGWFIGMRPNWKIMQLNFNFCLPLEIDESRIKWAIIYVWRKDWSPLRAHYNAQKLKTCGRMLALSNWIVCYLILIKR